MLIKVVFLAILLVFSLASEQAKNHKETDYKIEDKWLSCTDYNSAYRAIDKFISKDEDRIPPLVRLAFHDCCGKSCDGCLNPKDPHNARLPEFVDELEEVYKKGFYKRWSRADYWQMAGHVAIIRGGMNRKCIRKENQDCTFFDIPFWWGRDDCKTSPHHNHEEDTGSAHGDWTEVKRILHGYFGMTDKEMVAMMGAHSMGGAHKNASGFDYNWQIDYLVLDNTYHKNLDYLYYDHEDVSKEVEPDETVPANAEPRYEFVYTPNDVNADPLLMLHTDLAMKKHIISVKDKDGQFTGEVQCHAHPHKGKLNIGKHCKDAYTAPIVHEFAEHLDVFYIEFGNAWKKLVSNGYKHLQLPGAPQDKEQCGYCIPHDAHCVDGFVKSGQCCPGLSCVHNKCT